MIYQRLLNAKQFRQAASALLILALAACSAPAAVTPPTSAPETQPTPAATQPPETAPGQPVVLQSEKPRLEAEAVPEDELAELIAGQNKFTFDLYRQLAGEDGNLFYSPYSIALALAMTQAGARGETLAEMDDAMSFTLSQERLPVVFNAIDQALAAQAEAASSGKGEPFRLNIANSIWGQQGYGFTPEYLDVLAQNYGAGMRLVDFASDAEAARVMINDWIAEQTEDRIRDMIPEGVLDALTRLVLVNAIYFNAQWVSPFNVENTRPEPFHPLEGDAADVPMMHQTGSYGYAAGDGWQLVELPYANSRMVMDVLLPAEGGLADFEAGLSGETFAEMAEQISRTEIQLGLPKFEYEAEFSLKAPLTALGMEQPFAPGAADFSGMDGSRDLYIQDALHKAFVSVDEAGTEAAAATAVIVGAKSAPLEPLKVTVDRPFLFLIRDRESGVILFTGRVVSIP